MILADTGIWIAHFRADSPELRTELKREHIAMHPFIAAEIALGSLRNREQTLAALDDLPQVRVAHLREVRRMIELHSLYSRGIGLTDAHLLASVLIMPSTRLWTRDKKLRVIAEGLDIHADLP